MIRHSLAAFLFAGLLAAPLAAQDFNYGTTVAVGKNEILVGQPQNQYAPGMVYVYRPDAKGVWKQVARLTAEGATNGDGFGRFIALDGNLAMISSTAADSSRGVVYTFVKDAAGAWKPSGKLDMPGLAPNDKFGRRIAIAGDRAFITNNGSNGAGTVALFKRDNAGHWSADTVLAASDSEPKNSFGVSVAPSGNRLYVGAAAVGFGGKDSSSGAVYVYSRDMTTGAWKQTDRLTPDAPNVRAGFGTAILPMGDTVLIGSPGYDHAIGAVFRFIRDSTGKWSSDQHLLPFDGHTRDLFGIGLAQVGNELWVGAPGAAEFKGKVYRFTRDTSGWIAASSAVVPGTEQQAQSLSGFVLAAGASAAVVTVPGQDFSEGAVALYTRSTGGWKMAGLLAGESASLSGLSGSKRECTAGKVGIFDCQAVDLMAFVPLKDMGAKRGIEVNDIWGYTDTQTHHDYALVGRLDGTSIVDVTDAGHPVYVGDLPKTKTAPASIWRDIKTYQHYAFIVADGAREHGMQVFDLNRLRNAPRTPTTFTEDAHYSLIHSAHNIVIDTSTGYAYLVGGSEGGESCGGALHMVDIHDPLHPTFAGCFADSTTGRSGTGYIHDAQCVVYHGPDAKFQGREICFNFAETAVSIADVTDKHAARALSHQAYPNVGYAHQGWLTDDQKYLYEDDELDEIEGLVDGTRTLIWDVSDLENPVLAGEYMSKDKSSDHNLFVVGNTVYQSNYLSGLRVLDITDRIHPRQAGFFDTVPVGPDVPGFAGSWGNFPFFASGIVAVTSMKEGLFLLKTHPATTIP